MCVCFFFFFGGGGGGWRKNHNKRNKHIDMTSQENGANYLG